MARNNQNRKGTKPSYAGIPRRVIEHQDYKSLSGNAVKLLVILAYQFRGRNNGDLTAAWGFAKNHGFNSQATLNRATHELIDAHLIIRTREGVFLNPGGRCALYALSWEPINECIGKNLEVRDTTKPPRQFTMENKHIKTPSTETVSTGYRNGIEKHEYGGGMDKHKHSSIQKL